MVWEAMQALVDVQLFKFKNARFANTSIKNQDVPQDKKIFKLINFPICALNKNLRFFCSEFLYTFQNYKFLYHSERVNAFFVSKYIRVDINMKMNVEN